MALATLRGRLKARPASTAAGADWLAGLRPTRLLLAALVGAFVLSLLYVLQIQTLVRLGTEIDRLEKELTAEIRQRESLRIEMEKLHDLALIERRATFDLDMVALDRLNSVAVPDLPGEIDLTPPAWVEPSAPPRLHWWERGLIRLRALIESAKQSSEPAGANE